jgi:hypothetical protein
VKAVGQISGAVIASTLVLVAVFIHGVFPQLDRRHLPAILDHARRVDSARGA